MLKKMPFKLIIFIGLLLFLFPRPALAYLDPGTGSYLFQLAIAGFLASLFFIKTLIRKVKAWIRNISPRKAQAQNDESK